MEGCEADRATKLGRRRWLGKFGRRKVRGGRMRSGRRIGRGRVWGGRTGSSRGRGMRGWCEWTRRAR